MQKLHNKDFQIAFKTGSNANKSKFAKECVQGELYVSDDSLYIAESSAGASDSALIKYQGLLDNNYSLSFDGVDDYLNLGTGIGSAFSGASSVSVSLWFNSSLLPSSSSPEALFQQEAAVAGDSWLFAIRLSGSSLQFGMQTNISSGYPFESGGTASVNTWHHAVLTFDGSSTTMKGYLDGTSIATDSSAGTQLVTPEANSLGVIGNVGSFTRSFNGLIDEVAIFSSALSASDVTILYNGGNPSDISSLNPFGWWRMGDNDGGAGTTITDQGSGGNNGTLTNGPTLSTDIPS